MLKIEILQQDDVMLVHEKSLELLEKTGIKVESPKILELMANAGCDVDTEKSIIKLPGALVEECIRLAPGKFILGSLDGKNDMALGEGNTYVATDGQGCFAVNGETGEKSYSTMKDLCDAARLADALDYISCFWPIVTAGDVPDESRTLHEIVEIWRVSSKHITADCFNEEQAKYYMEILEAILGGIVEIPKRNILSVCCCPVTPLLFEGPMLEGTVKLGEAGVPVLVLPMPISGATAPMPLFSAIIQNNAETLAGNAILQTAHPGRPVIYGSAPGILDMSTALFCVGSPEGALENAACAQMAKHYCMPSLISMGGADAQAPGIQATAERMVSMVPGFMTGADILCGVGLTGTAQNLYLEEMVIADDIVGFCKRFARGVDTGEERALTSLVAEVGPGGNFLAEESTVEYLHKGEHYMPKVFCREGDKVTEDSPKKDIMRFAGSRVREILEKPAKENFSPEESERLAAILAEADKELQMK